MLEFNARAPDLIDQFGITIHNGKHVFKIVACQVATVAAARICFKFRRHEHGRSNKPYLRPRRNCDSDDRQDSQRIPAIVKAQDQRMAAAVTFEAPRNDGFLQLMVFNSAGDLSTAVFIGNGFGFWLERART